MKWENPPATAVISGKQTYLVRKEIKRVLSANRNRRLVRISGEDSGALTDAVSTISMFDFQDVLVLVENPEKLSDLDTLIGHTKAGENETSVVLPFQGDPPKGMAPLLKALPDKHHLKFPLPKPWDVVKEAISFCQDEARDQGGTIDKKAVSPLIAVVGTDYGVLSYEIQKAAAFARSQGRRAIQRSDLGRILAPVFEHEAFPVVDALGDKDSRRVLQTLGMVERTSRDDPTMKVCGLLGHKVSLWIKAVHLIHEGYEPGDAAARIGMHAFPFKKDLLPITKRWSVSALIDLLKGIASVERGVKTGRANPWIELNALLFEACAG